MEEINYLLIISASIVTTSSPGPATLAISGASIAKGRSYGLALASGVLTGSLIWSSTAAFGLGALMYENAWMFQVAKYLGACYLLYLAMISLRSALSNKPMKMSNNSVGGHKSAYLRGLLLHLTNPKAILFFGSLYSVGIPKATDSMGLISVIATVGLTSMIIFMGYAFLFSSPKIQNRYIRSRRVFESAFALFFGFAGFKVLTSKLSS